MLRHSIALVCFALTIGSAPCQADDPYLPVVVVTAGVDSGPVYLGDLGAPGYWTWSGSDNAETVPPYGSGWNAPEICSLLAIHGRPADCTRDLIATGKDGAPTLPQPSTWRALGISNSTAEAELFTCYTNPSSDPFDCEFNFKMAMARTCAGMYTNVYDYSGSPYANCESGRGEIDLEITYARDFRKMASWFGVQLSAEVGVFEVNINIPQFSVFNWSPFNRLLVYTRKLNGCTKWYNLWDSRNCDSYYSGRS